MRIGLFGGTLDPIHIGHLRSAEEAWEALKLDEIWFLPAGQPPHKAREDLTPFADRLAMTQLAAEKVAHFRVLGLEGERPGPSYSVDTLKALTAEGRPDDEFFFLMGSDAFREIDQWKAYRELSRYAALAVMLRDWDDRGAMAEVVRRALPEYGPGEDENTFTAPEGHPIVLLHVTPLAISATDIRHRARQGLSLRFLVPDDIIAYMEDHHLYTPSHDETAPKPAKKRRRRSLPAEEMAQEIAAEVDNNKGEDIVILDLRGLSSLADFFVIAHGRSSRHVQGMSDKMQRTLRKNGIRCKGVEGEQEGKWILMDYGDVVVHLFYEPVREIFDLEGLWNEAPRLELKKRETPHEHSGHEA